MSNQQEAEYQLEPIDTPHEPYRLAPLWSSRSEEWETPEYIFRPLDEEFHFTLDVCATPENAKCEHYFTKTQDAFLQKWSTKGGSIWMNPPYGRNIGKWMSKAKQTAMSGETVVCLVHARTDTLWFHKYVYKQPDVDVEIRFIKGRVKFKGGKSSAPFPSMIVIYRPVL